MYRSYRSSFQINRILGRQDGAALGLDPAYPPDARYRLRASSSELCIVVVTNDDQHSSEHCAGQISDQGIRARASIVRYAYSRRENSG